MQILNTGNSSKPRHTLSQLNNKEGYFYLLSKIDKTWLKLRAF